MNKTFIVAGLAGFTTLSIVYAQDNTSRRSTSDQVQIERHAIHQDQQGGVSVEEAILKKLMKANEGEIELAKMAQQQSSNQDVKNLAQHLISDHQNMNQDLQKLEKSVSHHEASNSANTAVTARSENDGSMWAMVPKAMCKIGEKACENNMTMTKEMLSQYKGQDFDMAYLGQQCVAHTMTLAELRAIESEGPHELQKMATDASAKVQEHLNMIKDLSKKLADGLKAPNS